MSPVRVQSLGLLLAGLGICVFGVWLGNEGRRASSWPTTDGRVTLSQVIDEADRTRDNRPGNRGRDEVADIRYAYSVEGKSYLGKAVSMSTGLVPFWEDAQARSIAERYHSGDTVVVHYDPADPRHAVLEPGASLESKLALLLGVGVIAYGLFWLARA